MVMDDEFEGMWKERLLVPVSRYCVHLDEMETTVRFRLVVL
jgi:hypothetical protein